MGTICILFGLIIFLGSILGGFVLTNYLINSVGSTFLAVIPNEPRTYVIVVAICAFIYTYIY